MTRAANLCVTHYDSDVPPFVEAELDRLYGAIYSSLAHFRVYGGAENASTYVVRDGEAIVALLLFRREKNRIRVINEWIRLNAEEVQRFADYVFATFKSIEMIEFHAVLPEVGAWNRPYQRMVAGENIQVSLPGDVETYVASLGSATRKNIKRHRNKLERTFPSFRFQTYSRGEADEHAIREIIRFNHARMAIKGKQSVIDEQDAEQLIRMVKERGFVTVATIDGRVCAGAITFRIGDTFVSRVNAHDPAYDEHRLGMICCFMTICACIACGGRRFDFMWGQYEYKTALLGVHQELHDLVLYRSVLHQALNGSVALRLALIGRLRTAKLRLLAEAKPADGATMTTLGKCVNLVRRAKRLPARVFDLRRSKAWMRSGADAA